MFTIDDWNILPKSARDFIIEETISELRDKVKHSHSLMTIIAEERELAVGGRREKSMADDLIRRVALFGKYYLTLPGNWKNTKIKHLIIFVKNEGKFVPYVRFDVAFPDEDSPGSTTKLEITNPKTEGLPTNYLGVTSGMDIYKRAFKGGAPNIFIL